MRMHAAHVLEDQLDPLQPGTAPLTVSRYLSSTLNHLATELITAADYPAALRALVFSRKVCAHELQVLEGAVTHRGVPPYNGRASQRDSDTNEARALLSYATSQLAATILELRSRYGIQQYHVEGPVRPSRTTPTAADIYVAIKFHTLLHCFSWHTALCVRLMRPLCARCHSVS